MHVYKQVELYNHECMEELEQQYLDEFKHVRNAESVIWCKA